MMRTISLCVLIAIATSVGTARALSLGPDDFSLASKLSCVLAEDSLGYLSPSEFESQVQEVLEEMTQEKADVIYSQALGYIDGLMFGIAESSSDEAKSRLSSFVLSASCNESNILKVNFI